MHACILGSQSVVCGGPGRRLHRVRQQGLSLQQQQRAARAAVLGDGARALHSVLCYAASSWHQAPSTGFSLLLSEDAPLSVSEWHSGHRHS